MKLIAVGMEAPNFTLLDNRDNYVRLSDFIGKKVLLSWHPLAWTPVCTDQMRALETNWQTFQSLNTVPLGFSVDSSASKKSWATVLNLNHVSLPADFWPHGKAAQDYGIFREDDGFSERANIIVDEKGMVMWAKVYPMAQLPDINEILNVLSNTNNT
jgi:peroxiredoxin